MFYVYNNINVTTNSVLYLLLFFVAKTVKLSIIASSFGTLNSPLGTISSTLKSSLSNNSVILSCVKCHIWSIKCSLGSPLEIGILKIIFPLPLIFALTF